MQSEIVSLLYCAKAHIGGNYSICPSHLGKKEDYKEGVYVRGKWVPVRLLEALRG